MALFEPPSTPSPSLIRRGLPIVFIPALIVVFATLLGFPSGHSGLNALGGAYLVGSGFIVVVVAEGALRRAARRGKEKGFDPKVSSKTSVVAVAYTAVPLVYERTGVRGSCIDDTGVILTTRDGT